MVMSTFRSSAAANNDEDNLSISAWLWRKCKGLRIFSLYSPFLLSMAANNLPQESFQHYNTQDKYFYEAHIQVCQICVANTDDGEIRKMLEHSARKQIVIEHREKNRICPATQNYINFLKGTAEGTVEELKHLSIKKTKLPNFSLCAMTPCYKLYYDAGTVLKAAMVVPNQYEDVWIVENAQERRKVRVSQVESFVDRVCKAMKTDEFNAVEKLYKHGMELELEFFQSQPLNRNNVIVPLWEKLSDNTKLVLNVGGNAILAGDTYVTSSLLENNLIQTQVLKYARNFSLNQIGIFTKCLVFLLTLLTGSSHWHMGRKLTCETLQTAVRSMEDIEKKITAAIGQQVILQRYGIDFFDKVLQKKEEYIIIQVNPSGCSKGTNYHVNELSKDDDKVLTIYVGSSIDEWTNLLKADIGIVIEPNEDLRRKGCENGVSFVPLFKGLVTYQSHFNGTLFPWKRPNPPVLYTVSSWVEIDAFILGSSEYALDC